MKIIELSSDCHRYLTGNRSLDNESDLTGRLGKRTRRPRKPATYILRKVGASEEVPDYSTATKMSLYLCDEEDCPTREALAHGQLWHSAAVHPKTGLLGDKQLCKKELAKPWWVLLVCWGVALCSGLAMELADPGMLLTYCPDCSAWERTCLTTADLSGGHQEWCLTLVMFTKPALLFLSGQWRLKDLVASEPTRDIGWYLQRNGNTWNWISLSSRPLQCVCWWDERDLGWTGLLDISRGCILHF